MTTKTIVFDLDDTIIKEVAYLKSAFYEICNYIDFNNNLLFDQMYDWYLKKEDVFAKLVEKYNHIDKDFLIKMYRNHKPKYKIDNDIYSVLDYLKSKNYKLGIITDGFTITQQNKINALKIAHYFDKIIISESFGSEKPSVKNYEIFNEFCTDSYFYIGDNTKKDFISPNKLGWTTVCLLDDGNNIHKQNFDIERDFLPKIKINNLTDLMTFL